MTRADLINSLGIGRMSKRAMRMAMTKLIKAADSQDDAGETKEDSGDRLTEQSALEDHPVDQDSVGKTEDDTVDTDDDDGDFDEDDEDEEEEEEGANNTEIDDEDYVLPCLEADIGGFYSALCALGDGVTIGRKVCCHVVYIVSNEVC